MANDEDYGTGSQKWPQTPGKPWQLKASAQGKKKKKTGGKKKGPTTTSFSLTQKGTNV